MTKRGVAYNRESFLERVASQLRSGRERAADSGLEESSGSVSEAQAGVGRLEVPKPLWSHRLHWDRLSDATPDELLALFCKQAELIHAVVEKADMANVTPVIEKIVVSHGGGLVICSGDRWFRFASVHNLLAERLAAAGVELAEWSAERSREGNIALAERANVALVVCDYALAESGTAVLRTRADQGRSMLYLPTHLVVVVPRGRLVPRMVHAWRAMGQSEVEESIDVTASPASSDSSIHLISGPSNSADIEMNLVVGVHGPLKVFYIVVDE